MRAGFIKPVSVEVTLISQNLQSCPLGKFMFAPRHFILVKDTIHSFHRTTWALHCIQRFSIIRKAQSHNLIT